MELIFGLIGKKLVRFKWSRIDQDEKVLTCKLEGGGFSFKRVTSFFSSCLTVTAEGSEKFITLTKGNGVRADQKN